ncbi:endothelial cell-selective adhesion molecule-like [Nothobranchius furzeri]|uniref:Endothelial cell-selective adhesion molecule-like n=1 Tax=Nothobranchius furzeri TaxID=105023 RepID=A0A9D2YFW0_NOTFU|nr:endothelial cell-selective adhesion molecule-like [Nothobranchius furzeri]
MEMKKRLRVMLVMLLWIIPGDTHKVEMPSKEMEVVKGQMVVLQAWYSPNSDISLNTIIWHFTGNESKQVINFSSGKVGHGQNEFTKRVGFSVTMPSANLSIYINDTQETDSGQYLCHVIVPGGPGLTGEMRLNVKVPPSPPVCSMTGTSVVKGNVTLSCRSSDGKPAPQYKWTKAAPVSEVFFSPMQSEYFKGVTPSLLFCITDIFGFLVFGVSRCKRSDEREDAQAPKRVSWAKSNTGSDIVSKNGTLSSIATSPRSQDPHQPNFRYPYSPMSASDTSSVINAYQLRPGEATSLQGLPGYNMGGTPTRKHKRPASANGAPPQILRSPAVGTPKRTDGAQPQVPPLLTASPQISSSTLTRMGAVAVMVPAQSQAGSLV